MSEAYARKRSGAHTPYGGVAREPLKSGETRDRFLPPLPSFAIMIKKIRGKYVVLSEHTGRKFGAYRTKKQALKRLRQIEFFKHRKKK